MPSARRSGSCSRGKKSTIGAAIKAGISTTSRAWSRRCAALSRPPICSGAFPPPPSRICTRVCRPNGCLASGPSPRWDACTRKSPRSWTSTPKSSSPSFIWTKFSPSTRFSPPPRFPAVTRDFALTYGLKTPYSALERAIWRLADEDPEFGALFESFELFDVYAGEQVAEGMRSLALSVVYRAADKTLTDKLVERADQRLIDWLQTQVQSSLRG